MLTKSQRSKLEKGLKGYCRQYLNKKIADLDESATRLMLNALLTEVLGYLPIEEVKTEYMIKGSYADYVIEIKGKRPFLVEAKAHSLELSNKHLRQAITYGAFEAIDWALVSNGRHFDFYRIIWGKPIEWRCVFSIDLSDPKQLKSGVEALQFLHKTSVTKKGLEVLWKKSSALDTANVAGLLYSPTVINFVKRTLKQRNKQAFTEDEVISALDRVIQEAVDLDAVNPIRVRRKKKAAKPTVQASFIAAPPTSADTSA
ncbi:MAG TPA: hypothetical protein VHL57_08820 [Flavobacteriales bacterium]|nr:hypothetical protein [Flavobacteriales bacterium]